MQTIRIATQRFIQVYKNHLSAPLEEGSVLHLFSPITEREITVDFLYQELEYVYLLTIDTTELSTLDTTSDLSIISPTGETLYRDVLTLVKSA